VLLLPPLIAGFNSCDNYPNTEGLGSSIYHYEHISIELLAYRTYWEDGEIDPKDHDEFKWISLEQLAEFDFAPADRVFVEKLQKGEIVI